MKPLAGGFPRDKAIENSATLRITRPGLDFMGQNSTPIITKLVGKSTVTFDIPESAIGTSSFTVFDFKPTICKGGPGGTPPKCRAEIGLGDSKFTLDAVTPSALRIQGKVPLKLTDTPTHIEISPGPDLTVHVGYGNGGCNGSMPNVTPKLLPVDISLPLVAETISPRQGYTKVDAKNADININISSDDVHICADCGLGTSVCNFILNMGLIKNFVVGKLRDGVEGQIRSTLEDQVCMKPSKDVTPPCPTGSKPDAKNAQCVYNSDATKCVPIALGIDGHIELGGLLSSFSPGTKGAIDFALAANNDMQPFPKAAADNVGYTGHTPNGMTLSMFGGAIPSPVSDCVKPIQTSIPTGIPVPDELIRDKLAPWSEPVGPHVGIGLSSRFLEYAFQSFHNSGVLCLGTSTEQVSQIQSGLLSLVVPSLKNYTLERKPAPLALTTRPGDAPKIAIGGGSDPKKDPLFTLTLPKFSIDFFVWSYDRYIRAFRLTSDLTIPLTLQSGKTPKNPKGGIQPVLGDIAVANASISHGEILLEDEKKLGPSLQQIINAVTGQFLGSGNLPSFDPSSFVASYNLELSIPADGIRKLKKGSDDFIGIFANFKTKGGTNPIRTTAAFEGKEIFADSMALANTTEAKLPVVTVRAGSPDAGGRAVEYSYRVDESLPSAWTRDPLLKIRGGAFYLQGKHTVKVVSRLVGDPDSESEESANVPVTVDVLPPYVHADEDSGKVHVSAYDFVSTELAYRIRHTDGTISEWAPLSADGKYMDDPTAETVEVRDEEGNVGQVALPLIRGRADETLKPSGGGCNCKASPNADPPWASLAIAFAVFLIVRKLAKPHSTQRLVAAGIGILGVSGLAPGCDCGSDSEDLKCGPDCQQECAAALPAGIAGAYTSIARAKDGTVWVAGYNDAALSETADFLYGDLVVGAYDSGKKAVAWQSVDGVPKRAEGCPTSDRRGWRGGESDAGDTVGLWTSIQMSPDDHPMVSYYDFSNAALKFAYHDGGRWIVHDIVRKSNVDAGRYGKMILDNGRPTIAFLQIEPGSPGKTRSKIVLAKSTKEVPGEATDWSFEDVVVDENAPCRANSCAGLLCLSNGACAKKSTECAPACTSGTCVNLNGTPTCSGLASNVPEGTPNVFGAYLSVARGPKGLGFAVYDRVHGNLVGIRRENNAYKVLVLDGETGVRPNAKDTGDVGSAASLAIAPNGDWHLSYVNGIDETLRYLIVAGGTKPGVSQIVDDGLGLDTKPFDDGRHIVGDDSAVKFEGGTVTIAYQDSSAHTLRLATGTTAGGKLTWKRKAIDQGPRIAGFFPLFVPGDARIANFWREVHRDKKELIGDVTLVDP